MSEDARSDFVLAAAGAALLPAVEGLLASLPFYPDLGSLARSVLNLAWIAAYLMFVPVVIGRHREQGLGAYDLAGDRATISRGLLVALPIIVMGTFRTYSQIGTTSAAVGQFALNVNGSPAITGFDLQEFVLRIARVLISMVGVVIFSGFLINRARDAFRQVMIGSTEAIRTFGMGAVAASILAGLLLLIRNGTGVGIGVLMGATATVAAVVLLADRLVPANTEVSRAAVLGPAIATASLHLLASGGIFGGNLLVGLWFGSLGFGLMVVLASLAGTRAWALAWVLPALASVVWPSCLSTVSSLQLDGRFCV